MQEKKTGPCAKRKQQVAEDEQNKIVRNSIVVPKAIPIISIGTCATLTSASNWMKNTCPPELKVKNPNATLPSPTN